MQGRIWRAINNGASRSLFGIDRQLANGNDHWPAAMLARADKPTIYLEKINIYEIYCEE